jgi:hypothetical protein
MTANQPKRMIAVPESSYGVCLWRMPNGDYFGADGRYLSMEGVLGDARIEEKMRQAAYYWIGDSIGQPAWVSGARKVSDDEYDDQSARLRDGQIPDEVDAYRQALRRK